MLNSKSILLISLNIGPSTIMSKEFILYGPYDRSKSNFRHGVYCPEMQVIPTLV